MPYKSHSREQRPRFLADLLYPASPPLLEVLNGMNQALSLLYLPQPVFLVFLVLAVVLAGVVYSLSHLRLSSGTG